MPKFNNTDILGDLRVTGVTIIEEPTKPNHAATKQYVDNIDPLSKDDSRITNWNQAYVHSQSDHAPTDAQKNVQSDWNATSGDAFIKNKPTIPSLSGYATETWVTDKGYQTAAQVTTSINTAIASVMTYKGAKPKYADLPSDGNVKGDFWNVTDTGINYAWDGNAWDKIGGVTDLSELVPTTRKVNNKQLNADISLTASDVGALPSSGGSLSGNLNLEGNKLKFISGSEAPSVYSIYPTEIRIDFPNEGPVYNISELGINLKEKRIFALADPVLGDDAANKNYVDNHLPLTGGTLTGPLTINNSNYDHINIIRGSGKAAIKYTSNEGGGIYIAVPDSSATADPGSLGWIKPTSGNKYSLYVGGNSHANASGKVIAKELYEGSQRVSTLTPTNIYIDGGNL